VGDTPNKVPFFCILGHRRGTRAGQRPGCPPARIRRQAGWPPEPGDPCRCPRLRVARPGVPRLDRSLQGRDPPDAKPRIQASQRILERIAGHDPHRSRRL